MADIGLYGFRVSNDEVSILFSCDLVSERISRAMSNMRVQKGDSKLAAEFYSPQKDVHFHFGEKELNGMFSHEAIFFENTDYHTLVKAGNGIKNLQLTFSNGPTNRCLSGNDNLLFGTVNFGNQVGKTDLVLHYEKNGKANQLCFTTEVLSFKMDYRTDMKVIIRDIEEEYSMLSFAFLRETYQNFKEKKGESTDLIWWQIFKNCYEEIVKSCRQIINAPRRRLHPKVRYERAERLRSINPEIENEYHLFKNEANHYYRTEELCHTNDTVENRFLKFVIKELLRRFIVVSGHIRSVTLSERIEKQLDTMQNELTSLVRHPFFRNIGQFHGFTQDSLVLKRGKGYQTVYQKWIILLCGYELEEGINKLEIKDISELYEIWCFLKVKNIVKDILGDKAVPQYNGKKLTSKFIRELGWGTDSEVVFVRSDDNDVELASVMYNAPIREEGSKVVSAVKETRTFTTNQRPDIILRLTKKKKGIKYTFLFDAKYRIDDTPKQGMDVPPPSAIDQMHRYRDAIYYIEQETCAPKREVIGGYVLFPGNYTKEEYENSYYHDSAEKIGIGAFPLRPSPTHDNSNNSEEALKEQVAAWLNSKHLLKDVYNKTIPQHGLTYDDPSAVVLVNYASPKKLEHMKQTGICYLRTGEDRGALVLTPESLKAQYVMLHNGKDGTLFRLKGNGPRFFSRSDLEKKGFEGMNHEYYLVYEFDINKFKDYKDLETLKRGGNLKPWFSSVSDLLGIDA